MTDASASIDQPMQEAAAALAGGDAELAASIMARVVAQQPANAACLACYGHVLAVTGQTTAALATLDRALAVDPAHVLASVLHGHLLGAIGHHAHALADFERALRGEPDNIPALEGQITALAALGRAAEALPVMARLLAFQPDDIELLHRRASVLSALHRHAEAATDFERVLAETPAHSTARREYGITLYNLGRHQEAADQLDRSLATNPSDVPVLIARGLAAGQLGEHEKALQFMERALTIDPGNMDASVERAVALGLLQRPQEALICLDRASRIAPDHVELLNARGASLAQLNRLGEALASYDRSLALDPDQPYARSDRALVLLALGDYAQGFREFEVRWKIPPLRQLQLATDAPLWTGTMDLERRTILLHHEQGFGDSIQFVRYVSRVAARGGCVILRVPEALMRLLSGLPGVERLVCESGPLPPHDFHCPLMSLPAAFGDTITTIPADIPYLQADPAGVERWRSRVAPWAGPRIGIAWAGRRDSSIADRRDLPLEMLLPLLARTADAGVQWISLQKDIPERDCVSVEALRDIVTMPEGLTDFADTAALMANLDLVLSVDTAVIHLAAALGQPAWVMNRHAPCWRWRNGSPWYPSVRQFGQNSPGDWLAVVEAVGRAIESLIQGWRRLES